ncbi:hypothetical protein D5S18_00730 [Nocardia panacis]|uniref:Discoidin domain-containing protein n=1 Tax=Nocardia panacis TaxID=2340916 RepID=A0A3A4KQ56_9NOCA|nr:discoidin domain-containing protein [Nocardia panacis]RJO79833.1 hypothetical protein D5S18_00730 [Nocardia panacis]
MPDSDAGDVILRHRGAILDALLADPALGPPVGAPSVPPMIEDLSLGPLFATDVDPSILSVAAPPAPPSAPVSTPRRARASDRINALLSGHGLESEPAGLSAELSALTGRPPEPEPPEPEPKPAVGDRVGPALEQARGLVSKLKRPRVLLGIAAVVVALLVITLALSNGGGNEKQALVVPSAQPAPSAAPKSETPAAPAAGKPLTVRAAQAHCPAGSTPPMDAFGGQTGKAWSCIRAYRLDGQVLTIDLGGAHDVDSIGIVPGWDQIGSDGADQWSKYRTVSLVSYQFDNGKTYSQQTLDQRILVTTKIEPPVRTSKITLTILKSKGDAAVNTTAISSIVVTGQ